MSNKEGGDPAASDLAKKRWENVSARKRADHAKKMAAARWGEGYVAQRPASSRKKKSKAKA